MDRLPQEIIDIIASFLPKKDFAPLVAISPAWRKAIEQRTFSRLWIGSPDLTTFATLIATRRALLRDLFFTVLLPSSVSQEKWRNKKLTKFEVALAASIRELFVALAENNGDGDGEDGDGSGGNVKLELGAISNVLNSKWDQRRRIRLFGNGGGETLPMVRCVTRLVLCVDIDRRRIPLRAAVDLARRMPRLRQLDILATERHPNNLSGRAGALHREDRSELAAALLEVDYSSLRNCTEVCLWLEEQDPYFLRVEPGIFKFPNLRKSLSYDPLSAALRMWSHNLVSFILCGVFDNSLFWPGPGELSATMPESPWPRLKISHIRLGLSTPAGGWYFNVKPETEYRNVPNEDTLQPLFESWAAAIGSMRVLEQATILFRVEVDSPKPEFTSETSVEDWMISFQAPGLVPEPTQHPYAKRLSADDLSSSRLVFRNVGGWRPQKSTMDALYAMRKTRFPGVELVDLEVDMFENIKRESVS
ncbi:hypothetical protein GGS26DRAFT_548013 [Hypomontagnella submonticulosa]|nr:hypothetical protein GGS26DRAFT_548013 [Hypomontagnella submonticulosa]